MYISRDECQTVIEKALKIEEKADSVTMKVQAGIIADIMIDAQTGYDVSIYDHCQDAVIAINSAVDTLSIIRMMTDTRTGAALGKVLNLMSEATEQVNCANKIMSPPQEKK